MPQTKWAYIVDDDVDVRRSTHFILGTYGIVGRPYLSGQDFLDDLPDMAPGCVLLDVRIPGGDGLVVLEHMAAAKSMLPVIVMTGHGDVATAVRAMKLGAIDFLEKPFTDEVLISTLDRGFGMLAERAAERAQIDEARALIAALTAREADVLRGLVAGMPNKALAFTLGLSPRTIEMHRANLMEKLGVRSLPEALRIAFRAGVEPASDS